MKCRKVMVILLSMVLFLGPIMASAKSAELTKEQKKVADKVASVAIKEWGKYGVLPSVAVAQTFAESSLGVNQVRTNNLWGLRPGGEYSSYPSVEDGIYAYLEVLNNGLYEKALHKKDYEGQLQEILRGGYYGEDDGGTIEEYYQDCVDSIEKYGFDKYDKVLFGKIKREKERKRKKEWDKTYTLVYDGSIPIHAVSVDRKIIKRGTVSIWNDNEMQGIYDVASGQKGRKIGVSNPKMDGMKVKIEVNEEAKG